MAKEIKKYIDILPSHVDLGKVQLNGEKYFVIFSKGRLENDINAPLLKPVGEAKLQDKHIRQFSTHLPRSDKEELQKSIS